MKLYIEVPCKDPGIKSLSKEPGIKSLDLKITYFSTIILEEPDYNGLYNVFQPKYTKDLALFKDLDTIKVDTEGFVYFPTDLYYTIND